MHETRFNRRYFLIYTATFLLLTLAVYASFFLAGKSLVGKGDGQSQYILQLRYMGEWLRENVQRILHGSFSLRTYDFAIGMGDDINAVVRFHPLDFLSLFVPAAYTEQLYAFLIFLRMYLAGLSFSLFAFWWSMEGAKVLTGAATYLFCGYVFELGIVHPTYLSPMIVLPLLLLGAEYFFCEVPCPAGAHLPGRPGEAVPLTAAGAKRPVRRHPFALFSFMVCMGFVSNYYFMYINSAALLIYVLIRFFLLFRSDRIRIFFHLLLRMTAAYVTGLLMSCITLLPTLYRYFHSYRSAGLSDSGNLLFYEDVRRYFVWIINLISPLEASGNGTHLNFSVVVLPAIVVLVLAGRRKYRTMKWTLLVLLGFLLVPLGGYILAVMHTENNRWVYLISLAVSMCAALMSDSFFRLGRLQFAGLMTVTVLFDLSVAALMVLYPFNVNHLLGAIELTAFALVIFAAAKRSHRSSSVGFVLAVTVISAFLNGFFTFDKRLGNLPRYYSNAGTTQSFFTESAYANYRRIMPQEESLWEDGFCRVDGIWDKSGEDNASLLLGYPGVQMYNSVLNASLVSYLMDTQNIGLTTMLHIHSLDGRTAAEALAGVRYFQTQTDRQNQLPYGFSRQVWTDGTMGIWENEYPLSFGYTTDRVIPKSALEGVEGALTEEIMLRSAVLEDEDALQAASEAGVSVLAQAEAPEVFMQDIELPAGTEGIERKESGYRVTDPSATLQIPCQRKKGCDVLIAFKGLKPAGIGARMRAAAEGTFKKVYLLSEKQTYTLAREDYLVSLGYAKEDTEDTLTIRFSKKGFYHLDSVRLICIPRDGYADRIADLNRCSLSEVRFAGNTVDGKIDLDQARYMVFQIPFSSGWSAQVDGKESALLQTDGCYLGLPLPAGEHEIRLVYHTPWGKEGAVLSLAGLILFLAGCIFHQCKRRESMVHSQ